MVKGKRQPKERLTLDDVRKKPKEQIERPVLLVKGGLKEVSTHKAGSRAALMAEAKIKGIKYFRILNKIELETVLAYPNLIPETITAARARWQAGWCTRKGAVDVTKPTVEME